MIMDVTKFDLRKKIVFDLKKQIGLDGQKAEVWLIMDKSGSMENLYKNGFVQRTVERVLPLAFGFDDDGTMPVIGFHNDARKVSNVTINTIDQVVPNLNTMGWGGTEYFKPLNLLREELGIKFQSGSGILGFFHKPLPKKFTTPIYVIFITDGDNSDKKETEKIIQELSTYPVYFQFIGIGNAGFSFLEKLDDLSGRELDNAGFFQANDLESLSDSDLYGKMLKEFPDFCKECKSRNLII